eukprot:5486095-Pyramimonas_sp.AAC.2
MLTAYGSPSPTTSKYLKLAASSGQATCNGRNSRPSGSPAGRDKKERWMERNSPTFGELVFAFLPGAFGSDAEPKAPGRNANNENADHRRACLASSVRRRSDLEAAAKPRQ